MNTRTCPRCKCEIVYKTIGHRNDAEKHNRGCRKCQLLVYNFTPNTECRQCHVPLYRRPFTFKRTPQPFCSFSCKNKFYSGPKAFTWKGGRTETQKRQHLRQKELKLEKKERAIKIMGGKCKLCGYNKCVAALDFHHIDPSQKDSDLKHLLCKKWLYIEKEIKKCELLCSNCHRETHWKENHNE